jgi:phosphopantothenoylcysteine decarboxylase/phosphopantothenate--cysteine ligase
LSTSLLANKQIVVGVTGSISIYKSLELIRLYVKAGAKVRVIMTESAQRFITPLTFEAISQNVVLTQESESWANDNNHIDIGKWADLLVIAPASANTLNKISQGIADNLLTQVVLAYPKEKLFAPAANTNMYKNPLTKASLKMIKLINAEIIEPVTKELACGDTGIGALADVEEIFYKSAQMLLKDDFWVNRRVVVSGGGTIEKIDDVRYISNFSSGKMASSLAKALYIKGADVCLVTTKVDRTLPKGVYIIDVEDAKEMQEYLTDALRVAKKGVMTKPTLMGEGTPELIQKRPYLFMAAAVSDYKVKFKQSGKLKKSTLGKTWSLELEENSDILMNIDKEGIFSVGFKAEMDQESGKENAKNMLVKKNLDAVCFNDVGENSFGSDDNAITLFTKTQVKVLPQSDKFTLSLSLLDALSSMSE